MKQKDELKQLLEVLPISQKQYLEDLFENCPQYVMETIQVKNLKKGQEFIKVGEPSSNVFIILRGKARGKELQNAGNIYVFRDFSEGDILGDFEVLGELDKCRVAISAQEDMEVLIIQPERYLKWMQEDIHALFLRVKKIMQTLTYQMSDERALLTLSCKDRLILFITDKYCKKGNGKKYKFHMTQSEFADCIGVTVRTIQRSIYSLKKDGMITLEAGKICVTPEQYLEMEKYRTEKLYEI